MLFWYLVCFLCIVVVVNAHSKLRGDNRNDNNFLSSTTTRVADRRLAATITGILPEAPKMDASDTIKYYTLQSAIPRNLADENLYNGNIFYSGSVYTYAAIGIHNVKSGFKFTIELVKSDGQYGQLFFPDISNINVNNQNSIWNNEGNIIFRNLEVNSWSEARNFATSNGNSYNNIVKWIQKQSNTAYKILQPINVVYATSTNPGFIQPGQWPTSKWSFNDVRVSASDTYSFVQSVINYSSKIGCSMDSFLPYYSNAFSYITSQVTTPTIVNVLSSDQSATDAKLWLSNMKTCAKSKIETSFGLADYVQNLKACYTNYGQFAYVYKDSGSVWKIQLGDVTTSGLTTISPVLSRYGNGVIASNESIDLIAFTSTDDILYIISVAVVLIYLTGGLYYRCVTKQRRRISMQGEQLSRQAAVAMVASESEDVVKEKINQYFYDEKKAKSFTLQKWWNRFTGNADDDENTPAKEKEKSEKRRRTLSSILSPSPRSRAGTTDTGDNANFRTESIANGAPATPVQSTFSSSNESGAAVEEPSVNMDEVVSPMQKKS
jgi:hypothetical protein